MALRVLSETEKFWIGPGLRQYRGISFCDGAAPLALKRASHDDRSAFGCAGVDRGIKKRDEVVGQAHGDLLAHPKTVPLWDDWFPPLESGQHDLPKRPVGVVE